jgi:hypothetical protein
MTTAMTPKMSNPAITANTITSSLLPESISQRTPLSASLLMVAKLVGSGQWAVKALLSNLDV